MPWGLKRYYGTGGLHFITCSCYRRQPLLHTPARRDLLLDILERMRLRYRFVVVGYVIMPEHFHLLMSEPEIGTPSTVMQAIKLGFVRQVFEYPSFGKTSESGDKDPTSRAKNAREMGHPGNTSNHMWQRRFYDFNLWSQRKEAEKLQYMHRNPVVRGLAERPEDWRWSSFRAHACGEVGPVRVADWSSWKGRIRSRVS